MRQHTFATVAIPFAAEHVDAVNKGLDRLGEPHAGNQPCEDIRAILEMKLPFLHFMTITVVEPICPAELLDGSGSARAGDSAHLLIELSSDTGARETLTELSEALEAQLETLFCAADVQWGQPQPGKGATPGQTVERTRAAAELREAQQKERAEFLIERNRVIGPQWRLSGAVGQIFCGTPGQTADRLRREAKLAKEAADLIDAHRAKPDWYRRSPRQRLEAVRNELWERGHKWPFIPETAPCVEGDPHNKWAPEFSVFNRQFRKVIGSIFRTFFRLPLLVIVLPVLAGALGLGWYECGLDCARTWIWIAAAVVTPLVIFGVLVARLRWLEEHDLTDDREPDLKRVAEIMQRENFSGAQNHLASVSRLKPGLVRRLALRFAFSVVGTSGYLYPPGFLHTNGVIHFARWMLLPGTDQLLFWSNYDGTWESYVADFIADAPSGVTAIWSNCVGFPKTKYLFAEGANDRNKLVRWARRQQHATRFWYSAYPDLTTARIRTNAAIRQGLASAQTDADARDWFDLFGSAPRPADTLQLTQLSTLILGGLPRLRYASCHVVSLDPQHKEEWKEWLEKTAAAATYGETLPGQKSATVVAFSAQGLRKLGIPDAAMATFPVAFQQGMWDPARARAIGDQGDNAPQHWRWGEKIPHNDPGSAADTHRTSDILVLLYGEEQEDLTAAENKILAAGMLPGCVHRIPLAPLPSRSTRAVHNKGYDQPAGEGSDPSGGERSDRPGEAASDKVTDKGNGHSVEKGSDQPAGQSRRVFPEEPFGFADGVSQPVIRGTRRANVPANANDVVAPGEILLGYPDNLDTMPPVPLIDAEYDPHHFLPDFGPDVKRRRPEFSRYEGKGQRCLGINGTFLVVRQLCQNVDTFNRWLDAAAKVVRDNAIIAIKQDRHATAFVWGNESQQDARAPMPRPHKDLLPPANAAADCEMIKDAIAAKLVGRWKDGTSLVRCPTMPGTHQQPRIEPDNDFLLGKEDPTGTSCPFGSHIRRANPRDTRFPGSQEEVAIANRHRILRVGRSYDPAHSADKSYGLLFMCLNADIERQFEFVQKTWLLNRSIHGLENEVDPILGIGERRVTIPTSTGSIKLDIDVDFVNMVGGGYFFLPGRATLNYLAANSPMGSGAETACHAASHEY